jgi:hypothetical protein
MIETTLEFKRTLESPYTQVERSGYVSYVVNRIRRPGGEVPYV